MVMRGIAVSEGIAVGPILLYSPAQVQVQKRNCLESEIEAQLAHYHAAATAALNELQALTNSLAAHDPEKAKIFTAHQDILADVAIAAEIQTAIRTNRCCGDWAIQSVYEQFIQMLSQVSDPLIQERADDLKDVRRRLLRIWRGETTRDLSSLDRPVVVAAKDLLPSDTASMDRSNVLAILTEAGGPTSHSAIIARSYGIPAVLGIGGLLHAVSNGQTVAVDARPGAGTVTADPDGELVSSYGQIGKELQKKAALARAFLGRKGLTADGEAVEIGLNIASGDAGDSESMPYVDFVGLFRTEFLYMCRSTLPDEEEQFQIYRAVLQKMGDRPVTLRTLDIGGDKTTECLDLPKEDNPFLGRRALRLCFSLPEVFRTQLRAALRASAFGTLWIMFPMVGSLEDFRRAKAQLEQARRELEHEGVLISPHIKVGMMIEIPSIAILADAAAREADFASIGTNDLCQYTMAADRLNPDVAAYCQSYHPAVFRLISSVADAFIKEKKPLSICGELGGDALAVPALVGLGIRKLSMGASSLAAVKQALSARTVPEMEALSARLLRCATAEEATILLRDDANQY